MALGRVKTWIAEVLTASDLNAEFNNILNNALSLISPLTGTLDANGNEIVLDADADTSITADTDDRLDLKLSGTDLFRFDGTATTPVNGFDFIASAAASEPSVTAVGSDTDISVNLVPKGTGRVTSTGTEVLIAGKQTIFVPVAAMRPTVSNGCAAITSVETTAGRPDMQVLDFDTAADEHAQFQVAFPKGWDEGTVTFRAFWTTAGAVTTGIAVALQGVAVSDDDTIDVAYGTAVVVTDDALNAAEDLMVTAESTAITIAGTPAVADMCYFRVFRDVSDANDDMTQDARLIGVQLFYTTDVRDDT